MPSDKLGLMTIVSLVWFVSDGPPGYEMPIAVGAEI